MFENVDGKTFVDVSDEMGKDFLKKGYQRGSAFGDLNNDGALDIVVTSLNESPRILMNTADSGNHWLVLSLVGHKSARDAIGAKVKLTTASGRVAVQPCGHQRWLHVLERQARSLRTRPGIEGCVPRDHLAKWDQADSERCRSRSRAKDRRTRGSLAAVGREAYQEKRSVTMARRRAHLAREHPVHEDEIPDRENGSERPPDQPNRERILP